IILRLIDTSFYIRVPRFSGPGNRWVKLLKFGDAGTGNVSFVGLNMPAAFNVIGSPITTSGTFNVTGSGNILQYMRGDLSLATMDTTAIPLFSTKVRSLFSAGAGLSYNSATGQYVNTITNNNQLSNGSNFITLLSLGTTSPLSYNNLTGVFSIQQANGS